VTPELAAFKRLSVRLSLGILSTGALGGSVLYSFWDVLSESHEPGIILFVHLAIVVFVAIAGALALVRDWVRRVQPRIVHSSPSTVALEGHMASLATTVAGHGKEISEIRRDVERLEGKFADSQAAIVGVIREEFRKGEDRIDNKLGEVSLFVTVARELVARVEAATPPPPLKPGRKR